MKGDLVMKKTDFTINSKSVSYTLEEDGYTIYLGDKAWISQHEPYIPHPELGYEQSCLKQIEELATPSEADSTQDEINAEMLLNQSAILAKQEEQNEVLAEILLNQMGGE